VSTPLGKHRRSSSVKSHVDRVHERLALAEAKQNIDSVRCKANILVTLDDRCYREDDATLSMEESESNEWLICVTLQDNSKFRHKPNEMRPCVVNRFTHAYMWTVDEVMRLEFSEKLDWLLFKELHAECRVRNSWEEKEKEKEKEVVPIQIPTPGIVVVPGYNLVRISDRFVRPDMYIRVLDDEVQRAMKKEGAIYEADSDDERWLGDFNGGGSGRVSLEEFEMLISLLEKDAYSHPAGVGKIEGVYESFEELKRDDAVVGVYGYWLQRRKVKENALVRFFQVHCLFCSDLIGLEGSLLAEW
jgi:Enhancer of polycomb-like